ncbi:MAG: hypothetical protein OXJ52_03180 [Oligoflexia bacterium]|nr:hypothetical protein [Oligoflexia bacterium]
MNPITKKHHKTFEDIRQKTKQGGDFWSARDLQTVLDYKSWDKFKSVIAKATRACKNSGNDPFNHFSRLGKMVKIGSGAERHIPDYDYRLTRYEVFDTDRRSISAREDDAKDIKEIENLVKKLESNKKI